MKRKQGKHIHKEKKRRDLERVGKWEQMSQVHGASRPCESRCDCSITPVMCLRVFGNSLDIHELINVTLGIVLENSRRIKAGEYWKASVPYGDICPSWKSWSSVIGMTLPVILILQLSKVFSQTMALLFFHLSIWISPFIYEIDFT